MWRQDDLLVTLNRTASLRFDVGAGLGSAFAALAAPPRHPPRRLLPGPPLMHGTGLFTAMAVLDTGGTIVMPPGRRFDPIELLDTIQGEGVTEISIVGDAFAQPILAALDADPDRWDLRSLWLMVSSGVMWSAEVKAGLSRHLPRLMMVDSLGSSEAISMAQSTFHRRPDVGARPVSPSGPGTKVIGEDGPEVVPGSGQAGHRRSPGSRPDRLLQGSGEVGAHVPRDRRERWPSRATWPPCEADGVVKLLGRGSQCGQHRRREGLPRGGRGGPQAAPGVSSTPSSSACPTSASARWWWPWPNRSPGRRSTAPT